MGCREHSTFTTKSTKEKIHGTFREIGHQSWRERGWGERELEREVEGKRERGGRERGGRERERGRERE